MFLVIIGVLSCKLLLFHESVTDDVSFSSNVEMYLNPIPGGAEAKEEMTNCSWCLPWRYSVSCVSSCSVVLSICTVQRRNCFSEKQRPPNLCCCISPSESVCCVFSALNMWLCDLFLVSMWLLLWKENKGDTHLNCGGLKADQTKLLRIHFMCLLLVLLCWLITPPLPTFFPSIFLCLERGARREQRRNTVGLQNRPVNGR